MSNPTHELLTVAQDLIRDPKNWTQGSFARDNDENPTGVFAVDAHCWCAVGALQKARTDIGANYTTIEKAFIFLARALDIEAEYALAEELIPDVNDVITHKALMAGWEKAKELALAQSSL